MFQHVIVPVDGSDAAWAALPIAARMAAAVDGAVDVVSVVDRFTDVGGSLASVEDGIDAVGPLAVTPAARVLADVTVARAIANHVEVTNGAIVVMSSHGHGRSAAVLGSTADDLLRLTYGPLVVVGPHVSSEAGSLDGTYVVPVDGSDAAETIAPIAGAWALEFGAVPWVVEVADPSIRVGGTDLLESSYPARIAGGIRRSTSREVEYEVLHHHHPAEAIVGFADEQQASLIFAATHGRTGMARLRLGSVAADMVRHATCPIVLYRPPRLPAG
jgi:nucleotide-binding universal stress UspA family protein